MQTNPIRLGFNERDRCFYGKYKDPRENKWKTKFVPKAYGDEEAARQWFADFLNQLGTGAVPKNDEVRKTIHTLATAYPLWCNYLDTARTNKSGNLITVETAAAWKVRCRNYIIQHAISQVPLTVERFTPINLLKWLDWVKTLGLAKYTLKDVVQVGRTMVGDCRKKGWIDLPYNPFADEIIKSDVPIGETIAGKDNPIHLSQVEACTLMASDSELIPMWRKVKNVLVLCTGLRDGETCGLSWNRVQGNLLVVDRQLKRGGVSPVFAPPKRGSIRTLPLHKLAREALESWKAASGGKGDQPIFPSVIPGHQGQYFRSDSADQFRMDLRAAGLSDQFQGRFPQTIHSTRRTFMTLLADAGVSDVDLSILVGHAGSGVRRHYVAAHVEKFVAIIQKLPYEKVRLKF
jgi:integrase